MARKKTESNSPRELSVIELTVLGMTWLRGPCSTYAVMKELSTSESTFYKSRAGTAYSVVKRLVEFKLLEHVNREGDTSETNLRITSKGLEAIQTWLTTPIPIPEIAHSVDFVRLRFFFLGAVDVEERLKFIDHTLVGLQKYLVRCESLISKNQEIGDYFGALATMAIILETKARIDWLTLVRNWVETPIGKDLDWSTLMLQQLKS